MIKTLFKIVLITFVCINSAHAAKKEWKEYKQKYFIIYYQNAPIDFVKEVAQAAKGYYVDITKDLGFTRYKGWTWDERAEIYIYDDQEHYVQASRGPGWSAGHALTRERIIRTFPAASGFFDTTLPHELGHIIFREFVGFKAQIPRWFEEGVAMYQERAKRWGAHKEVREAIKNGNFIPLDELSLIIPYAGTDRRIVDLFYAESASAVNYMITELGQNRFVRFCRKLEEGDPFDWALKSVYVRFKTTKDLNKAWVRFLK